MSILICDIEFEDRISISMLLCDIETGMGKWLLDVQEQLLVQSTSTKHLAIRNGHRCSRQKQHQAIRPTNLSGMIATMR